MMRISTTVPPHDEIRLYFLLFAIKTKKYIPWLYRIVFSRFGATNRATTLRVPLFRCQQLLSQLFTTRMRRNPPPTRQNKHLL